MSTTHQHYHAWAALCIIAGIFIVCIEPCFSFVPQRKLLRIISPQQPTTHHGHDILLLHKGKEPAFLLSPLKATKVNQNNNEATTGTTENNDDDEDGGIIPKELDENQVDFTVQYMNEHHGSVLLKLVETFSELGRIQNKQNAYTSGSYELQYANLTAISAKDMELEVAVRKRRKESIETVTVDLDAKPIMTPRSNPHAKMSPIPRDNEDPILPIDDMVRRLIRLCWIIQKPKITGLLIQMALQLGGRGIGKLKENMYLNQVPHNRYVRQYFYGMTTKAVMEACILCSDHKHSNRMQIVNMFPETNPSMDSYRIGTLLELVREIATELVVQANLRVRVCVQQSMGSGIFVGIPKQLGGVAKLLPMMDWQSNEGELYEGMVGDYINFGGVGKEYVVNEGDRLDDPNEKDGKLLHQDDVFLIIAPQSMVGTDTSIHGPLSEMVEAAGDRPVILLNPDLTDKVSSGGQQSFRGRQQRIDFANSFQSIYHFSNLYVSGTSYFPILGALTKLSPTEPWVAHQRRDYVNANGSGELYVPILAKEERPSGEDIMECMEL